MLDSKENMNNKEQLEIFAAAIYEIRCQLGKYLGSKSDHPSEIRLVAHLAYALHNESLEVINGCGSFDVKTVATKIYQAETVVGSKYIDQMNILKKNAAQQVDAPEPASPAR